MTEISIKISENILLLATALLVLTENGNSSEFVAFKKQLAQKFYDFHYQMSSYFITSSLYNFFIAIYVASTNSNNVYNIMQGFFYRKHVVVMFLFSQSKRRKEERLNRSRNESCDLADNQEDLVIDAANEEIQKIITMKTHLMV